jgi:hypothetical protein
MAFLPSPSLAGEGGRCDTASRNTIHIIQDFYIQDSAANPDSGFLCSGKVRGTEVRCTILL